MMNTAGYLEEFANRVHDARIAARLSQAELASRAGVSRHTIVNIETGRSQNVTLKNAVAILGVLGLELRIGTRHLTTAVTMDPEYLAAEQVLRNRHRRGLER